MDLKERGLKHYIAVPTHIPRKRIKKKGARATPPSYVFLQSVSSALSAAFNHVQVAIWNHVVELELLLRAVGVNNIRDPSSLVHLYNRGRIPQLVVWPEELHLASLECHNVFLWSKDTAVTGLRHRLRAVERWRWRKALAATAARCAFRLALPRLSAPARPSLLLRRLAAQHLINRRQAVDELKQSVTLILVKLCSKVECHRHQPRVAVHGDERKPVLLLHSVTREVDA
mmetsp:Transcript_16508/g.42193  ORF Transcript_16508/g.42193 Transcript_16508/m.42193 type:complete len:229 (-) Transcript_16508:250-936(-)